MIWPILGGLACFVLGVICTLLGIAALCRAAMAPARVDDDDDAYADPANWGAR